MKGAVRILGIAVLVGIVSLTAAVAQQDPAAAEGTAGEQVPAPVEADVQWQWGEIVAVSPDQNSFTFKYLDYEADVEKEISVFADADTVFENVTALNELKAQDTVSIDFVQAPDGKYLAKNVSVEKPEVVQPIEEEMPPMGGADAAGAGEPMGAGDAPGAGAEPETP